jgi:hypothetical protein
MYWRFYGLIGFIFLLSHHFVLADELVPSPVGPNALIMTDAAIAGLLLPAQDSLGGKESHATLTANKLAYHSGPPSLALPTPVQGLVGPWLSRLKSREPTVVSAHKATGYIEQSPRQAEKKTPVPRVDQVWRVAPAGALARKSDGMTVDGDFDLGLEVHAGSTKEDRATNVIKGITSTRVTLLPESYLQPRLGQYLGAMGKENEIGKISRGEMRMVLATDGGYEINPSTGETKHKGEVIGTLSWMTTARDRFIHDPWQVVAFRWQPTMSCEGRSIMGDEKKKAEVNRLPLATLTGNLRGDLRLDFLSPRLATSGNYQYGQGLTDAQTKWDQATFSWNYQLNSQVSLGGSFTQGKRSPNQQTERGLKLEIGVMF